MEESLPVIQFTHRTTGEVRVGHFHPPSTKLPSEWTDGYGERVEAPEDITDWMAGGAGSGGGGEGGNIQDLLDGISTTRGSLLYRDAADWEDLAPGIEGAPLVSGGAGANPVWGLGVENVVKTCKNDTGVNITKGTPVKVTGVHGELPKIEPATASNTHVPSGSGLNEIFGIAATTINASAAGPVLIQGTLTGLNTSAYSSGNFLYVPTSGTTLTATPPAVPYDRICIALVTKVDATDGQICVRTPQPVHLNDITGFNVGTLTNGDIIRYDSATNTFVNAALPAGGSKTLAVFTPLDNQPTATNFATLDTRNSIAVLDFDDGATNEESVFVGMIPEGAVLTGGIKVRIVWMATTATSGDCRWGVQFERGTTDLDSDSFDTATEAHSTTNGTSGITTVTEITATAIDSLVAGDQFRIKVYRDSSDTTNDTMTGDAELVCVELRSAN